MGNVMNLLEHLYKQLRGPKEALAKQLLVKPWNINAECLSDHVPKGLYQQFISLRQDVRSRLEEIRKRPIALVNITVDKLLIGVHSHLPDGSSGFMDGNARIWADQIWAQVIEDLEQDGIPSQSLNDIDRGAFIALYSIAHACLFTISELIVPHTGNCGQLVFVRNQTALHAHQLYWFSHYWAHQSTMADHVLILNFVEGLCKTSKPLYETVCFGNHEFRFLCNHFIDKFLSLNPDYMALIHSKDQFVMNGVIERFRLILYIYLSSVAQQIESGQMAEVPLFNSMLPIHILEEDLKKAGFSEDAVQALLQESRQQAVGNRFLESVGTGRLQIGNLSLKYALRTYCHAGLSAMKFRGDWFEQDYIVNYIRDRVPTGRYRVFPGIQDKLAKYDADVIIEDTRTHTLLFCQVKHRTAIVLPHLRDELKEYSGNSQILHGLEQLRNLRNRLNDPTVIERVRQSTGDRQLDSTTLAKRSDFLLINNIENLDFCTNDGIGMYEWNTLRNLMNGKISEITREGAKSVAISNVNLRIGDPHQVMLAMLDRLEQQAHENRPTSPKQEWMMLSSSKLMFHIFRSLRIKKLRVFSAKTLNLTYPLI